MNMITPARLGRIWLTAIAMLAITANCSWATPVEWTVESGGNGHFYEVITMPAVHWTEAYAAALLEPGWDLASVTSQGEQDFIISLLPASPFNRQQFWIGGYQPVTLGSWEWTDGEAFGYTDWWPGEPNDPDLDQIAMDWRDAESAWHWNDLSLHASNDPFISGYVAETVPEPSTALMVGLGLSVMAIRRRGL